MTLWIDFRMMAGAVKVAVVKVAEVMVEVVKVGEVKVVAEMEEKVVIMTILVIQAVMELLD